MKWLVCVMCLGLVGLGLGTTVADVEIHVSRAGNDGGPGTAAAPFASLPRAQREVRQRLASGVAAGVTVLIHAGTYELEEPLVFGPQDSAANLHVQYRAAPGDPVVISGGRSVTGWQPADQGRWQVELESVRQGDWFFRQLVVDDQRAIRARWPNEEGVLRIATVDESVREFSFNQPLAGGDLQGQQAELVVLENWSVTRGRVVASDSGKLTTATAMGWIGHGPATTASPGKACFLEHGRQLIDCPGEWFLDPSSGVLTYLPAEGVAMATARTVAPRLMQLIRVEGTAEHPVENLSFHGIEFAHADFRLPEIGYNEIQAAHYGTTLQEPALVQPVAIELAHARNCAFESCRVAHVNGSGLGLGAGCRNTRIVDCTIEDVGGTGVIVGWRGRADLEAGREGRLDGDWKHPEDVPRGNQVVNCTIRRCGQDSFGAVGLQVAFAQDTRVAHNHLYDLPYTGVSLGFRWDDSPTSQARSLVEANHIHHVMQKLADGGGIYTLGRQPGTRLRRNYIHDVPRSAFAHGGAPNNGFFIDQGSHSLQFEANVVQATSGEPVRFNQSQREWHTWDSNYFSEPDASSPAAQEVIRQAGPREAAQ